METVKLKGYFKYLPIDTIVHMEGDRGYTKCYFSDGRMIRLSCKIGFANQQLSSFSRVHKSHLVNPKFIQCWSHTDKYKKKLLRLITGITLPIAQRRIRPFLQSYSKVHI